MSDSDPVPEQQTDPPASAAGATDDPAHHVRHRPSRRAVITTSIGVLAGAAAGVGGTAAVAAAATSAPDESSGGVGKPADAYGQTQAGIDRPATPQTFAHFQIGTLKNPQDLEFLAAVGRRIATLTTDPPRSLLPDGPRGLTVTVGLGPRVMHSVGPGLPGAQPLPQFRGDDAVTADTRGGDLLLTCCADDPSILPVVVQDLTRLVPGWEARWSQFGYRGPSHGTVARNPLGFLDGISVPHTPAEFDANVWLPDQLKGGTICVLRRFRLRIDAFTGLPASRRERIIGRRLNGSPLSGGGPDAEVNLNAKHPDGSYVIPAHAHVRVANPMLTGSHHMLRRSYSYDNGPGDSGLLFTCYQRDLRTFVVTQRQLDQSDDLMHFATPTASATFLILPGYTHTTPLGGTLPTAT